ncbi:hypothetical protein QYM36_008453 [Artemia franciscana]|uniref:PPM-type phosphatase domain-containing protein n=1 Tax=Artemia franciscana TaxID=6661 RepID=A0AA88LMJ4_ARTSF|nr:hypothetical protein QYM36_008453 [Artemia franciscana]
MDDPTESKILQDAIAVHIRIFLKFTSKALSSEKVNQNYSKYSVFLSAEFIFAILAFFILVFFRKQMQTLHDIFAHFRSACYLTRIEAVGLAITTDATSLEGSSTNEVWEAKGKKSACFALRGRRPKMEDRFTMIDSISDTEDIGIYAIYDGHGGEFAAEFIQKRMVERIRKKIEAVRKHIATSCFCSKEPLIGLDNQRSCETNKDKVQQPSSEGNIKDSEKKIENAKKGQVNKLNKSPLDKKDEWDPELLEKSCGLKRYISGSQVSLAQIIQDEIMALDLALLEVAKKSNNIAGTTLLFALHDRRHRKLVVANVGDSRGIMCDLKGKVIPLSFDHKPQQVSVNIFDPFS